MLKMFSTRDPPAADPTASTRQFKRTRSSENKLKGTEAEEPKRILFVRHAEDVGTVFGPEWVDGAFSKGSGYNRFNLNLPAETLPMRTKGDWSADPPITQVGHLQAKLLGRALHDAKVNIHLFFSAPELRCVQTVKGILKGMDINPTTGICVEAGLENGDSKLSYLPNKKMREMMLNVNPSYKGTVSTVPKNESMDAFHERLAVTMKKIVKSNDRQGGTAVVCTTGPVYHPLIGRALNQRSRTEAQVRAFALQTPLLALSMVECQAANGKDWKLVPPPVGQFACSPMKSYDWTVFKS